MSYEAYKAGEIKREQNILVNAHILFIILFFQASWNLEYGSWKFKYGDSEHWSGSDTQITIHESNIM